MNQFVLNLLTAISTKSQLFAENHLVIRHPDKNLEIYPQPSEVVLRFVKNDTGEARHVVIKLIDEVKSIKAAVNHRLSVLALKQEQEIEIWLNELLEDKNDGEVKGEDEEQSQVIDIRTPEGKEISDAGQESCGEC